jgi:hypothetical protein
MKYWREIGLVIGTASILSACGNGQSACEEAIRKTLPIPNSYELVTAVEEPGETPAMTYYVIEYTTSRNGRRMRETVHCSYQPDFNEAVPNLLSAKSI